MGNLKAVKDTPAVDMKLTALEREAVRGITARAALAEAQYAEAQRQIVEANEEVSGAISASRGLAADALVTTHIIDFATMTIIERPAAAPESVTQAADAPPVNEVAAD